MVQTEKDLKSLFPKKYWNKLHLQIIGMEENIVRQETVTVYLVKFVEAVIQIEKKNYSKKGIK